MRGSTVDHGSAVKVVARGSIVGVPQVSAHSWALACIGGGWELPMKNVSAGALIGDMPVWIWVPQRATSHVLHICASITHEAAHDAIP